MFDRVVDAVLIFGFPLGVLVGYMWRDCISRARRARYLAEREAERNRAARDAWQLRSLTDGTSGVITRLRKRGANPYPTEPRFWKARPWKPPPWKLPPWKLPPTVRLAHNAPTLATPTHQGD
jgi:hypothetical protein